MFVLFHAGLVTAADDLPGVKIVEHDACLDAAVGMFEGVAGHMAEIIGAVRVARLELEGGYDADRHDAMLARFDWQAFTEDEFLLMPPVVAIETGEKLRGELAASFTRLMRGGRPIHVLVVEPNTEADACEMTESLASYHPGLGYVAVAHREPFVLQSTLAYPQHLMDGLKRMVTTLRPAVAVVATPVWDLPGAHWLNLAAAHAGRNTPCFRYDPGAGGRQQCHRGGRQQPERPRQAPGERSEADGGATRAGDQAGADPARQSRPTHAKPKVPTGANGNRGQQYDNQSGHRLASSMWSQECVTAASPSIQVRLV